MSPLDPDLALVERARNADQGAFRELVERHANRLFGLCRRILDDAHLADDAVQDALISAWRELPRFDGRARFSTWLHRIAVNSALMLQRSRRGDFEQASEVLVDAPASGVGPEQGAGAEQVRHATAHAMASLTEMERRAFGLRHFEGFAIAEIAAVLGVNDNACKQAVFRAVRKMREALSPYAEVRDVAL
jgi:RNA polymerase sigma-70 factor (ECF subfamily)